MQTASQIRDLAAMIRFEAVTPSVRTRTFAAGRGVFADFNLIVIVMGGTARLRIDEEVHEISSHSVAVIPHGREAQVQVSAGTRAWILGFARPIQSIITGTGADSLSMDRILNNLTLTPGDPEAVTTSIAPLLPLLDLEIRDPSKRSHAAVAALMRLILIAVVRMLGAESEVVYLPDVEILHRFRQLVELGYRSRRRLAEYCHDLNLTYDRLHDICQRQLQRTPLALIHQRILLEASTRLLQTDEAVTTIADHLGFDEPTKFSHFFKRATGMSPRQFRQKGQRAGDSQAKTGGLTFSDWP